MLKFKMIVALLLGSSMLMLTVCSSSPVMATAENDVKQRSNGVPTTKDLQGQQEVQRKRDLNSASTLSRFNIPSQIRYYFDENLMNAQVVDETSATTTTTTTTTVKPTPEVSSSNKTMQHGDGFVEEDGDATEKVRCTNCANQQRLLTDPEIRQMRIDEIKGQILRKLRLETPPNITIPRSMLPQPLMEGDIVLKGQMQFPSRDIEDFYGKMEQVIVMAENDVGPDPPYCQTKHYDPAACFYFKLTDDISDRNVESAELWVYKLRDRRDRFNQTYVVSEFARESNSFAYPKTIVAISETDVKSGWIRIDLAGTVKRWLSKPRLSIYGLQISCKTCSMNLDEIPVSYDPGEKPFIVINLKESEDSERSGRNRRSVECADGVTQCCRESLYVNFSEIGWNDWIVQPSGYYANYCRGSCVEDVAVPLSTSHHTTVMQVLKYYVQKKTALTAQQKAVFAPCCTPTRMSSISLIYQDDNKKILQNNLPNMVVESCGCF